MKLLTKAPIPTFMCFLLMATSSFEARAMSTFQLPVQESKELEVHASLLAQARSPAQTAAANKIRFELETLRAQCGFEARQKALPLGCLDYVGLAFKLKLLSYQQQLSAQNELTRKCLVLGAKLNDAVGLRRGLQHDFLSKSACAPILERRLATLDYIHQAERE